MIEIDVKDNYVVDTGYLVGFTEGLSYEVHPVAGLKSLFFSGEGLVCGFQEKEKSGYRQDWLRPLSAGRIISVRWKRKKETDQEDRPVRVPPSGHQIYPG